MSTLGFGCFSSTNGVTSAGTLSELLAIGAADAHLTSDPSVTYWRLRVEKCTNFAMESIQQNFTGSVAFGQEAQITLNRTGDLIYWMYVVFQIPAIAAKTCPSGQSFCRSDFPVSSTCNPCGDDPDKDDCTLEEDEVEDEFLDEDCSGLKKPYANWVDEIGFAAIARVAFSIGGQVIDSLYSHYMHMWEELSGQPGKRLGEMIGKRYTRVQLVEDSRRERTLYVPLPFYFTRHSGNALPLVSLQFHSLQVHVTFAPLRSLIQVSDVDVQVVKCRGGAPIGNNDLAACLDSTYVYLDIDERDRFAIGQFMQLITQVQYHTSRSQNGKLSTQLNFNHPTLELIWAVQRKCQGDTNNTFDYWGKHGRDPIHRACLKINNLPRFDREAAYFRLVQPYQAHTNIPHGAIYCYSFALEPESCQPSGSLNFSRIDNTEFSLDMAEDLDVSLIVFARNVNVLRFKEGLGGLLFSNIIFSMDAAISWI